MNKNKVKEFIKNNNFVSLDDCTIDSFKNDDEFAKMCLEDELKEYLNAGEPYFLKNTLKQCLKSFGFCNFERISGISRKTLYNIIGGNHKPKLENILKIIKFLGYEINLTPVKQC